MHIHIQGAFVLKYEHHSSDDIFINNLDNYKFQPVTEAIQVSVVAF